MDLSELRSDAESGIKESQYVLAICFQNGLGVECDKTCAMYWYKKSAENGFAPAQYELSKIIVNIDENDVVESIIWLRAASSGGYAPAQFLLSLYFELGVGAPADSREAFRLALASAQTGYKPALRRAALMYEQGKGTEVNIKSAIFWHEQAAEKGIAGSAASLGQIYSTGVGVQANNEKALDWLLKGANAGSASACFRLASAFRFGLLGQLVDSGKADDFDNRAVLLMEKKTVQVNTRAESSR